MKKNHLQLLFFDIFLIIISLFILKLVYNKVFKGISIKKEIYFDNASTTKIDKECLQLLMNEYQKHWYNPSSIYKQGQNVSKVLKTYKQEIANKIGASSQQVFFVSGSTEANNIILRGVMEKNDGIIISKMEHPSIYKTALDISPNNVLYVNNDSNTGLIDIEHLDRLLDNNQSNVKIVSIIGLSNITGTIQKLSEISSVCKKYGVWFHCDTTQWIGKFPFNVEDTGVDSCCASAHKFHGCKQTGFLYIKNVNDKKFHNIITGGEQQLVRSGTEALPQISCMVCSMNKSLTMYSKKKKDILSIRNYIINNLVQKIKGVQLVGFSQGGKTNAPHIINVVLPFETRQMVEDLGKKGICLSIGSACSKGKPSQALLKAFKIKPEKQLGSLRISMSYQNTLTEARVLVNHIVKFYQNQNQKSSSMQQ